MGAAVVEADATGEDAGCEAHVERPEHVGAPQRGQEGDRRGQLEQPVGRGDRDVGRLGERGAADDGGEPGVAGEQLAGVEEGGGVDALGGGARAEERGHHVGGLAGADPQRGVGAAG